MFQQYALKIMSVKAIYGLCNYNKNYKNHTALITPCNRKFAKQKPHTYSPKFSKPNEPSNRFRFTTTAHCTNRKKSCKMHVPLKNFLFPVQETHVGRCTVINLILGNATTSSTGRNIRAG